MHSSPLVDVEKYIHRLDRSRHFTMDDFLLSKSIPKIILYSESQKMKFMENEKKLRKGEHFTFQMLEHYQQWLQFTLTLQKLEEEKNIFIILRALPKDVSEQELPKWIEIRNKIAKRQLVRLKNKLEENGPKYYYYVVSQIKHDNEQMVFENESINLHMIKPDDYQRLSHFIEYYDRGNESFSQWTLRWRFDPPREDQYDSFDEFYLKRVRNWDQKDPRYKRNLEVRLLFARYAGFIHVMLAKKFKSGALLNMDYLMAASLLKSYCGDTPLQYQTPFFKGIRFYEKYLQNFYFQVDVYTSHKTTNENGMVEQRNSFFQNYVKLVEKKKKILLVQSQSDDDANYIETNQTEKKWITSTREIKPTSSFLRPEFQWIMDSIPTDLSQIQWEGMQEMNEYLPKLQNFEENYISKTPNLYLPKITPAIDFAEYYGDVQEKPKEEPKEKREQLHQDDVEDEQEQPTKNIKVQKYQQIKQLISYQPVRYSENGRNYFQCHCGSRLTKLYPHTCKNQSHSVDPSLTQMDGFIEFYRTTKSRHYGLCLHCDNVMSMDNKIKEKHPSNNFQYSVLDYPLDIQNISLYTGPFLTNIFRVQVRHSYPIPFKTVYQQYLQLPENAFKNSRSPDIFPNFSYGNRTIVLAPQIKGMTCSGIQKGTVFGPVGGNIVPSYVKLSQSWSRIQINQEYDWVPLCHYTLASLQIVADGIVDQQPNITLVFAVYEKKIYAFWKATRYIPLDGKLVAHHKVNPQ